MKLQLKYPDSVVDPNEPFGDDKLERRGLADALSLMISDSTESLVIALNGGWGTGKTFFLDRWTSLIRSSRPANAKVPCVVTVNAWQDDDVADPLLALVGQIHHSLHTRPEDDQNKLSEDIASKAQAFYSDALRVMSIGAKHLSGILEHFTGVNAAEIVKGFSNFMSQRVSEYSDVIQARVDIKKRLFDLAKAVWQETGRPLIVVIDDLDRCKPSFAVAMLERIKHLFNVQFVVFVLGVDYGQLSKSLINIYGDGFDARNYMMRLIDVDLQLPKPRLEEFVGSILNAYKLEECLRVALPPSASREHVLSTIKEFKDVATYLAENLNLSLRSVERMIREVVIIQRMNPTNGEVLATLILICICTRMCFPDEYRRLVEGNLAPAELLNRLLRSSQGDRKIVYSAERHVASVVFSCIKNSSVGNIFDEICRGVGDESTRKRLAPSLLADDQRLLSDILATASSLAINHNDVVRIHKALSYFSGWKDTEW